MSAKPLEPASVDSIATTVMAATKTRGLPPVEKWNPPFCGDLDMRIARDGTWFYLGTPIGRFELVKLFSSVLRKDGDKYFLVTPVEKVGITVDDAPFVAVDFTALEQGKEQILTFETQVGDFSIASADNPIRIVRDTETGEPSPYVHIRAGLEALIDRKSFYRLIDLGTHETHHQEQWFGVYSSGTFFPIIPSRELNEDSL